MTLELAQWMARAVASHASGCEMDCKEAGGWESPWQSLDQNRYFEPQIHDSCRGRRARPQQSGHRLRRPATNWGAEE
jgi:hypothetical protein